METTPNKPEASPLGKSVPYQSEYDPSQLFSIPRQDKRAELNIAGSLPFFGIDIWNAYEVSWLNMRGKPQIAIATIMVPADSPNIVESKSMKLYFNSFNQTRLEGEVRQAQLRAYRECLRKLGLAPPGGVEPVRLPR